QLTPLPTLFPYTTLFRSCYYCDDNITVSADLAGKQAPCPSCRRIVKVPLPVKQEKKDWRDLTRTGPSAAKENIIPAHGPVRVRRSEEHTSELQSLAYLVC